MLEALDRPMEGWDVIIWRRPDDYDRIPVINIFANVAAAIASLAVLIAYAYRRSGMVHGQASRSRSLEPDRSGEGEKV